jgi:DNA polymerase III subunit epsilon
MRQIFLDTETTGLSADAGDRIVELGCVEMVSRRLTGQTLHHYLNPERPSHEEAVRVHGLTDAFLADKPKFAVVAEEFIEFVRGADIVIHNAAFDVSFLDAELRRLGLPPVSQVAASVTDTLLMAREQFPGKANSLDALCKRLEVDNTHRTLHGALLDAELLAEVYIRLTRGQNALVIDNDPSDAQKHAVLDFAPIDFAAFDLQVIRATEEECAAHATSLADVDKACGGKTLWRAFESAETT